MAILIAGIALIILGSAGIGFRRVFVSMARGADSPGFVSRAMPFMSWRGWLLFDLFLILSGIAVLIYRAI